MTARVCTVLTRLGCSQDSFYFDPAPVSQVVVEEEDLRLRCDVSSRQYITFYWTLNDRTLANTSRRYQDGSDLRILSVNRTLDAGSFRCVAVNVSTGIAVRSGQAQLTIYCKSPSTVAGFRSLSILTAGFEGPDESHHKCLLATDILYTILLLFEISLRCRRQRRDASRDHRVVNKGGCSM